MSSGSDNQSNYDKSPFKSDLGRPSRDLKTVRRGNHVTSYWNTPNNPDEKGHISYDEAPDGTRRNVHITVEGARGKKIFDDTNGGTWKDGKKKG